MSTPLDSRAALDALVQPTRDLGDVHVNPGTERARWILTTWPHVIEANELQRTLRAHATVQRLATIATHLHNQCSPIPTPLDPSGTSTRDRSRYLVRTSIVTRPRCVLDIAHQHHHATSDDLVDAITYEATEPAAAPAPNELTLDRPAVLSYLDP